MFTIFLRFSMELFLTLLSGLYVFRPSVLGAEEIYFGFSFPWLEAFRGIWMTTTPWRYFFLWEGFIIDFRIYALPVAIAVGIYAVSLPKKDKNSRVSEHIRRNVSSQ